MTKNNANILKAEKELLERLIQTLYEELDVFAGEMNSEKFYAADGIADWEEAKKKINSLYKKAKPFHEIRDYLQFVLDSKEQYDLDKFKKEEDAENEGE